MSEPARKILYLVVDGLPESQRPPSAPGDNAETLVLTEKNAAAALEKIFAADTVAVWSDVKPSLPTSSS